MKMYPTNNLYKTYKKNLSLNNYSDALPDVTKKMTLENMNCAINLAEKWDHCMDIGGGTGHYLAALANYFKHATLVETELFPEHEQLTKKFLNIEIFHSYIEKYTNETKADFILLADLFEHIPDIQLFVRQLSSLQNMGGVVYIMTPNPVFCGPAPQSGLFHSRHPNGHIKHYTTSEITVLMKTAGYELELSMSEESPLRQNTKRIVFALSKRDCRWNKNRSYKLIRPIFLSITTVIFWIIEGATYKSEQKNRFNQFTTLTQDLVFKKKNET